MAGTFFPLISDIAEPIVVTGFGNVTKDVVGTYDDFDLFPYSDGDKMQVRCYRIKAIPSAGYIFNRFEILINVFDGIRTKQYRMNWSDKNEFITYFLSKNDYFSGQGNYWWDETLDWDYYITNYRLPSEYYVVSNGSFIASPWSGYTSKENYLIDMVIYAYFDEIPKGLIYSNSTDLNRRGKLIFDSYTGKLMYY